MHTRPITKQDFDHIVSVIDRWWDGPISTLAHPIFFYELGHQALVVENEGLMLGFLLGFIAEQPVKTGYVHLVGIHPEFRRQGVGRLLYERFTEVCRRGGCVKMKAITTPGNEGSIRFHLGVGWAAQEDENYAGEGRRRIVFTRELA